MILTCLLKRSAWTARGDSAIEIKDITSSMDQSAGSAGNFGGSFRVVVDVAGSSSAKNK